MNMYKLAYKFLFSRKKWLCVMVCSLAIIIAAVTSIFTSSEAIKEGLKEEAYKLYGEHSGILTGIDEDKKKLQKNALDVGEYQLVDTMVINKDKVATIGWMDHDAVKMGHIKLLRGTFPKKRDEVAIESAYLQLLDKNWKIGEKRKIRILDKEVNVRLVGIVHNYSAQWSVPYNFEKGANAFPNIFVSHKHISTEGSPKNFLIKLANNKVTAERKIYQMLDEYNQHGAVNERLFNKGLADYDHVSSLSIIFQSLTLLLSLFCIISLFSCFNLEQSQKIAILKAIGSNNQNLYSLYFYQCMIIFFLSLVVSIPLHLIFHFLIIENSFEQSMFNPMNIFYLFSVISFWLLLLFWITFFISIQTVKNLRDYSINEMLSRKMDSNHLYDKFAKYFQTFTNKQLARQLLTFPKQLIFTVIILCFSILLITFSFFVQKESAGIWDTTQHYYLTSQETYGFDTVENLTVLKKPGLTFSVDDVRKLEKTPGILYIDKNPFMKDVHPLIDPDSVTPSIRSWMEKFGLEDNMYKELKIIPNISYTIVDSNEFEKIYSDKEYKDFIGKVLLFIPSEQNEQLDKDLIGENLRLVKMVEGANGLETKQVDFKVLNVINKPFVKKISKTEKIENDEITIVLDEKTALGSGIFPGYYELGIYTQKNLLKEEYMKIDSTVNRLVATIPGSLFQSIPKLIKEDSAIYSLVGFLGLLSFIVAVVLSIISIMVIVFSKYNLQKRNWGIYLSLGMNKKQVIGFLTLEMISYLFMAAILSTTVFIIAMFTFSRVYSFSFYLKYYSFSVLSILFLMLIGSFVLGRIIKEQSVSFILRRVE
jgi:putative ABC transport system permease protein